MFVLHNSSFFFVYPLFIDVSVPFTSLYTVVEFVGIQTNLTLSGSHLNEIDPLQMFCKYQITASNSDRGTLSVLPYLTTIAMIQNNTSAQCLTPALDPGRYVVSLGTLKDTATRGGVIITSVPQSQLRRIMPDKCPNDGNCRPIRIHGNHFRNVHQIQCVFGENTIDDNGSRGKNSSSSSSSPHRVSARYISSTMIECTPPNMQIGATTLSVEHADTLYRSNALLFTLYATPFVNSISPNRGSTRGGMFDTPENIKQQTHHFVHTIFIFSPHFCNSTHFCNQVLLSM